MILLNVQRWPKIMGVNSSSTAPRKGKLAAGVVLMNLTDHNMIIQMYIKYFTRQNLLLELKKVIHTKNQMEYLQHITNLISIVLKFTM